MLTLTEAILKANPKSQIYCDMDGVLVDIIGGICSADGKPRCSETDFEDYLERNKKKFDSEHPRIFARLPWMKDGKGLWSYISQFSANILSAHTVSWQPTSKEDKTTWIKREMRPLPSRIHILLRHQKREYAVQDDGTPNILIDDWEQNIVEWKAAGGIPIHHKNAATTIATLKKLGFDKGRKTA
jgi:5'(3')-deoxyribonucleotidase